MIPHFTLGHVLSLKRNDHQNSNQNVRAPLLCCSHVMIMKMKA